VWIHLLGFFWGDTKEGGVEILDIIDENPFDMVFVMMLAFRASRRTHGSQRHMGLSPEATFFSMMNFHNFSGESLPPDVQQDIPIIATSSLSAPIRMEAGEDEEGDNEEEHKLNVEVLELSDMISIHDDGSCR
jgi:hypothetical protein